MAHFVKTNDFELAGKGGLLMAMKYKIISLLICSAAVIKFFDVMHLGGASCKEDTALCMGRLEK